MQEAYNGDPPGHGGEGCRGDGHGDEDDPERLLAIVTSELPVDGVGENGRQGCVRGGG